MKTGISSKIHCSTLSYKYKCSSTVDVAYIGALLTITTVFMFHESYTHSPPGKGLRYQNTLSARGFSKNGGTGSQAKEMDGRNITVKIKEVRRSKRAIFAIVKTILSRKMIYNEANEC